MFDKTVQYAYKLLKIIHKAKYSAMSCDVLAEMSTKSGMKSTSIIYVFLVVVVVSLPHQSPRCGVSRFRSDQSMTTPLSVWSASISHLLVKLPLWWRSDQCRQCYSDFLLQCAGDVFLKKVWWKLITPIFHNKHKSASST